MYDVMGDFKIKYIGAVRNGEKDGKAYAMRSLGLAGSIAIGQDVSSVDNLEVVTFKNEDNLKLWDGLGTLNRGDSVEAVITFNWGVLKDAGGYNKVCLRPRGLVALKVVDRADAEPARKRVVSFEDII